MSLERLEQDANGDLLYTFTRLWSDGTTGIKLSPLELLEKLAAFVPLPPVHLVRYGGCLAPHSKLRGAIIPTPRQQGVAEPEAHPPLAALELGAAAQAGVCHRYGALPHVSAGHVADHRGDYRGQCHQEDPAAPEVAVDPPPIAPAHQAAFAWDFSSP